MATITKHLKGAASAPLVHIGGHKIVAENILDFSLDGFNVAAADVVKAIILPDNAILTDVRVETLTVEGGVAVYDVGSLADPNGWVAAADANALGGLIKGGGALAANGLRYNANATLDLIPSADLDTARILVIAEYYIQELA
jgi:hypothetical protein